MEVPNSIGGVPQVGNGFPCVVRVIPSLPMYEVLQTLSFVARVHDALDFVFLLTILHDVGGARGSHRLTREAFAIWLYAGDVDNGVNAHRAGKTVFDGVCPDQLHDGIGTEPPFRQLPGSSGETEIVSGKPDLISDGICRSV